MNISTAKASQSRGVVTYMSRAEAFATEINSESIESKPFLMADQGTKVASELTKSTNRKHVTAI